MLVGFWRRLLAGMPSGLFDDFVEMDIPAAPATPSPGHVRAPAELVHLTRAPETGQHISRQLWLSDSGPVRDRSALLTDLAAAHTRAAQRMIAGDEPEPGPELDLFVAAHAAARAHCDTPAFRRRLASAAAGRPTVTRYWTLTAEVLGTAHTTGATQDWLHAALDRSLRPTAR